MDLGETLIFICKTLIIQIEVWIILKLDRYYTYMNYVYIVLSVHFISGYQVIVQTSCDFFSLYKNNNCFSTHVVISPIQNKTYTMNDWKYNAMIHQSYCFIERTSGLSKTGFGCFIMIVFTVSNKNFFRIYFPCIFKSN